MKLRNYQSLAETNIFDFWRRVKRILVVLPTGCGKTVLFASVIKRLLAQPVIGDWCLGIGEDEHRSTPTANHQSLTTNHSSGRRVLVLAHREELITQAKDKIEKINPSANVQIEMAEYKVSDYFGKKCDIVVSTVQTQISGPEGAKRMTKFDPRDFAAVIIDEAHHATAKSYREVIDYYCMNENCRVLGVTATPDRADETALGNVFDAVAFEYTVTDAIEDGWLVPVKQKLVKVESLDFSGVSTSAGDLNSAELAEVMEDEKNLHGIVAPVLEICRGKKTILFAASVKQAERICEIINRSNTMRADWICGATPKDDRHRKLDAFKRNEVDVMCNVGILTEGFDDSGVEVIVMARPTKSRALYAQMAGRATRPAAEIADKLGEINSDSSDATLTLREGSGENPQPQTENESNEIGCVGRSCETVVRATAVGVSDSAAALRRKMIAESSKPSCLIVDFVGNSGRHKLVTTLDILGGKDVNDDEIRSHAKKLVEQSETELDATEALEQARKEIEAKKAAEAKRREFVQASATYVQIDVDPFNIYDLPPVERGPDDKTRHLSLKQEMILRTRLRVDPNELGYARSAQLLKEFFRRANEGLASLPQAKLLKRFGIEVPLRRDEAKRILDRRLAM